VNLNYNSAIRNRFFTITEKWDLLKAQIPLNLSYRHKLFHKLV